MSFKGFEPQERANLEHPFLKVVVAQVRFPHLYEIEEPGELVASFQKRLAADYPNALPREEPFLAISFGASPSERPQKPFGPYRFKSTDEQWLVSLAPDFVALEASSYADWEVFQERLRGVLAAVSEVLQPSGVQRLGLRYVNEVQLEAPDEWRRLFSPELLGLAADDDVSSRVVQTASQTTFSVDDHFLTARHGLVLKDDTARAFVLDLDAFMGPSAEFAVDDLLTGAATLKATSWSFFRASITNEYLARTGVTS